MNIGATVIPELAVEFVVVGHVEEQDCGAVGELVGALCVALVRDNICTPKWSERNAWTTQGSPYLCCCR